MKIDRVFVLLLVVMLPMTGCFDDAVGEADAQGDASDEESNQTNQLPVIYSQITRSGQFDIILNVMAQDYDGNITEFGLDLNLDGTINMQINPSPYNRLQLNYTDTWFNPSLYNPENSTDPGNMQCMEWIQLIAIDDDGGAHYLPIGIFSFYGDDNSDGTYECTNQVQNVF
jgi:hypothetical protein